MASVRVGFDIAMISVIYQIILAFFWVTKWTRDTPPKDDVAMAHMHFYFEVVPTAKSNIS